MLHRLTRRQWLSTTTASVTAALTQGGGDSRPAPLATVKLRANGKVVPRLGLGCFPLSSIAEPTAVALIEAALAAGIRYLDTAPSYGAKSESETRIGKAIAGQPRAPLFLATKTLARDADGARRDLDGSLRRLGVSHIDLVQVHEIHDDADALDPDRGVLKALLAAVRDGVVGAVGVTCHRDPEHALAALRRHRFASVLCPVNPIDPQRRSFVRSLLPKARAQEVDVIAMKLFAGGALTRAGRITAAEALAYGLSQDVTVVVPGCQSRTELDQALAVARGFRPLEAPALARLEQQVGKHEGKTSEWYKT